MVASIGSSSGSYIEQLMEQMQSKMKNSDTDGISGLSKDELTSVDTVGDSGGSAFLQSLNQQFDSIDADKSGQLSFDEISKAKPPDYNDVPFGPPPGMMIDSSNDDSASNNYSTMLKNLVDSFGLDINQDGEVTSEEIKETLGISDSEDESKSETEAGESTTEAGTEVSSSSETVTDASETSGGGFEDFLEDLTGNFLEKLLGAYKTDGASSLVSTLTSMV